MKRKYRVKQRGNKFTVTREPTAADHIGGTLLLTLFLGRLFKKPIEFLLVLVMIPAMALTGFYMFFLLALALNFGSVPFWIAGAVTSILAFAGVTGRRKMKSTKQHVRVYTRIVDFFVGIGIGVGFLFGALTGSG